MAKKLVAINLLRPRIKRGRMWSLEELDQYIASRSVLQRGLLTSMVMGLNDAMSFYLLKGSRVKVDMLGIFRLTIKLNGRLRIHYLPDKSLLKELNSPGMLKATVLNQQNKGKTAAELCALWNELYPEDPVETDL